MMNFFNVRAADAAGGHAKEKFALTDFRNRHRLDRYAALAAIDARAHVSVSRMMIFPVKRTLGFNWTDC